MDTSDVSKHLYYAYLHPRPLSTNKSNLQGQTVIVYSDGGCRPNPGQGAIGVCITHTNLPILNASFLLAEEECTNNVAEYVAAIAGIAWAGELVSPGGRVHLQTDSELVHTQISGDATAGTPHMRYLRSQALQLIQALGEVSTAFTSAHIPRELNTRADELVQSAYEGREGATLLLQYEPPDAVYDIIGICTV